jgi:hypothetical protein
MKNIYLICRVRIGFSVTKNLHKYGISSEGRHLLVQLKLQTQILEISNSLKDLTKYNQIN